LKNETLEKQILASSIYSGKYLLAYELVDKLSIDDFYYESHRHIFMAIKLNLDAEDDINFESIYRYTPERFHVMLTDLSDVATQIKITKMLEELRSITVIRNLQNIFIDEKNFRNTPVDIIPDLEKKIQDVLISGTSISSGFTLNNEALSEYFKDQEEEFKQAGKNGVKTGLPSFDNRSGGFRGGEEIVIAARPGMGKSSLMMTFVVKHLHDNLKPAVFSLEMGRRELINKLYSMTSEVNSGKLLPYKYLRQPHKMNESMFVRQSQMTTDIISDEFYINTDPRVTFSQIRSICRERKRKGNLDIVYIDHIGLLVRDRRYEREELTDITNESKRLAKELDVPIVLVVQLRRDLDKGGIPNLGHLKGSGSIEEDADIVLFPFRPYTIDKKAAEANQADLIIGKGRNFETENITLNFSTDTTLFTEVAKEDRKIIENKEIF